MVFVGSIVRSPYLGKLPYTRHGDNMLASNVLILTFGTPKAGSLAWYTPCYTGSTLGILSTFGGMGFLLLMHVAKYKSQRISNIVSLASLYSSVLYTSGAVVRGTSFWHAAR